MPYESGEAWKGNASGRPKGTRNKRTQEILDMIAERGDTDPLDYLSGIVSGNGQYTTEQKTIAANYLLPYKHSKCGTTPVPRYIAEPIELPHLKPQTLEQINENINFITELKAQGRLDIDIADSFINGQRAIANNLIAEEELKLKIANSPAALGDQTIQIVGGLPALPGTSIIMPEMNGMNGHAIEGIPQPVAIEASQEKTELNREKTEQTKDGGP
jgi:hypothetical protein